MDFKYTSKEKDTVEIATQDLISLMELKAELYMLRGLQGRHSCLEVLSILNDMRIDITNLRSREKCTKGRTDL